MHPNKQMPKHRDMQSLPASVRAGQLWCDIDDVISRLGIARSTLWLWVKKGDFPPPYQWRGRALWTQADVRQFIADATAASAETPTHSRQPVEGKSSLTWNAVLELMRERSPGAFTNREIAHLLNADQQDVSNLTRLMARAGELRVYRPLYNANGGLHFYTLAVDDEATDEV